MQRGPVRSLRRSLPSYRPQCPTCNAHPVESYRRSIESACKTRSSRSGGSTPPQMVARVDHDTALARVCETAAAASWTKWTPCRSHSTLASKVALQVPCGRAQLLHPAAPSATSEMPTLCSSLRRDSILLIIKTLSICFIHNPYVHFFIFFFFQIYWMVLFLNGDNGLLLVQESNIVSKYILIISHLY